MKLNYFRLNENQLNSVTEKTKSNRTKFDYSEERLLVLLSPSLLWVVLFASLN